MNGILVPSVSVVLLSLLLYGNFLGNVLSSVEVSLKLVSSNFSKTRA